MPYTVLKVLKADSRHTDVLGEFVDEETAEDFARVVKSADRTTKYEYLVEAPAPRSDFDAGGRGARLNRADRLPSYLTGYRVGRLGFEEVYAE
jgi:hypothetical protein